MALKIFVFENSDSKEKRHSQVQSALRECTGIDSAEVLYTSRGKPYVKGLPEEKFISVTTADEVMVVVFSDKPVGIDGEHMTRFEANARAGKPDYATLAERFFMPDEADYVRDSDSEGEAFARIWVAKEAYCKYTGKGLSDFVNFSVSDGVKLYNKIGGVPLKKLNVAFPGSNEYLFYICGEDTESF